MPFKYLVCGGGGYKIVSYLGILQYMWESHELDNIKNMCGVSGGSIVITLLAIGYSPYEIKRFFLQCYTHDNEISLIDIGKNYGIYGNNSDNERLRNFIRHKTNMQDCRIRDIYRMFGVKIYISVYCLNKGTHFYAYPNWKVIDSINASCAIPFFSNKCELHRNIYVDPCFICGNSYSYSIFEDKPKKEVLLMKINDDSQVIIIKSFIDYAFAIIKRIINIRNITDFNYTYVSSKSEDIPFIFITETITKKNEILNKSFKHNYSHYKKTI